MSYNELKIHGTADFPIELYRVDCNHPKYEMIPHWHYNIEIVRILEGKLLVTLNNREYHAVKGDIVFINSETIHGAVPDNCVYECMAFNQDFLPALTYDGAPFIENLSGGVLYVKEFFPCCKDRFHDCVNQIFDEMKSRNEGTRYSTLGLLCHMMGIIITESRFYKPSDIKPGVGASMIKLKNVLTFIRHSYDTPMTLEDMAHVAGMSTKYFCSFFKEMTHSSPVDYLITYRIERAARQLLSTDKSVTDIAFSCGFNDLSYFIKTFKAQKGRTPGAYRKM